MREPADPPPTQVPAHLTAAELVYVRKGGKPGPLAPPYSSPYKVIDKGPKYFTLHIGIGGQPQAVKVDHLKPACRSPYGL